MLPSIGISIVCDGPRYSSQAMGADREVCEWMWAMAVPFSQSLKYSVHTSANGNELVKNR
jgi:hypothetical protein